MIALSAGGGSVRLAQRDGELWIESPFSDRADRDESGGAARGPDGPARRALSRRRRRRGARSRAGAGDDRSEPRGKPEPFRSELGGPTGEAGRFAARAGGQLVELRRLAEVAGRTAESWRARAWSSLDTWSVDALTAKDAGGTVALTRHEGDWKRDATTIPYAPIRSPPSRG